MHFSTQVDFSRRFGKTIGNNIGAIGYEFKTHLKTLSPPEQRKMFNDNIESIIKSDILLCTWLYYSDYNAFISELKNYILTISETEFNSIISSSVSLGQMIDIFWIESNDQTLKTEYTFEKALEEYKERVKKNGYTYDKTKENEEDEHFKSMLKNIYYKIKNEDLHTNYINMTKQFDYARLDDVLQCRTKENWEILYSIRYIYKNIVNLLLDKKITGENMYNKDIHNRKLSYDLDFSVDNINEKSTPNELYEIKKNIEDWLSAYQETSEGLAWHNPYSDKPIDTIEYFPRETSKPEHDWAYSKYYNLENNASTVVNNMINMRKRKLEETQNKFSERINRLKELMEKRNERIELIKKITGYIHNGIYYGTRLSLIIALSAIVYSYFF